MFKKEYWETLWDSFLKTIEDILKKFKILKKSFNQARGRILYTVFGNLFPILLGPIVLYFIKEDFDYSALIKPQNLIIYSATFSISSMFIWKNNSNEKKDFEGMLFYIILILIITILFSASFIDYSHKDDFEFISRSVFVFTILLYTYQEIKTVYAINKNENTIKEIRKKDIKNLEDDFDNLNEDDDEE